MVSTTNKRVRHKKSRKGCVQCKSRHVKCDEQRPICSNCTRLGIACNFVPFVPGASPFRNGISSLDEKDSATALWTNTDMRLFHHYVHCSCLGFSVGTARHQCWTQNVPNVSFQNSYLLHQILAVAALHVHLQDPGDKDVCNAAAHHRSVALEGVQPVLTENDPNASVSLFAFAGLTAIYCFGELAIKRAEHVELDIIGELTSCFRISRGITTVLTARRMEIEDTWAFDMINFSAQAELAKLRAAGLQIDHMQKLSTLIESRLAGDTLLDAYMHAAVRCEEHISLLLFNKADEAELSHLVMTWPHEIQEEFVTQLDQREPVAMVILAHYAVLMTMSSSFWWLDAWPCLLLDQIQRDLPSDLQHYLTWPSQMLGNRSIDI